VYAAKVEPGDTVAIFGIGGIGINAVQGARLAGASNIIAVDPLANKREIAEQLGATHSVDNGGAAIELAQELTDGVGADKTIITVDIVNEEVVSQAFDATRKGGRVVITGLADPTKATVHLSGAIMTLFRKEVIGTLFGNANPTYDIPKMLRMYRNGDIKLDELITRTYTLDEINQGYDDLLAGKNMRGVLVHDAA
jgi:S-(hydroxymethyl)glutathione dehydrogenase/alcohol dehydrogenase